LPSSVITRGHPDTLPKQNDRINLGFRVDNLLGNEWQNFHSTGLFDNAFRLDHVGFDLVQLYGEIHLPVLTRGGLDVKGGRFFALSGYVNGPAPMRPLLSSSYVDYYANPFTLFGVLTTLHLTDQITLYNGAVNGWDRWIDAHDKWNYTGGFTWFSGDGRTEWTITVDSGPSQFPRFLPPTLVPFPTGTVPIPPLVGRRNPDYSRDIRTLVTSVVGHEWTNNFTTIVETDLGYEDNIPGLGPGGTGRNTSWYGAAGWFLYDLAEKLTGVYRAEFFSDVQGARTRVSDTFYETTLGLIYRPRSWLWVRPEARFDWAARTHPFNEGRSGSQFTFGFDMITLF